MNGCPAFDVLSRFADGALEAAPERDVAAHIGGCGACRAVLASLEEVDGLLTFSLPPARRFRLLRPSTIPVAAAVLFALILGVVLSTSPGGADSPMDVAEASPRPVTASAEPVRDVFFQDLFAEPRLSPLWKATEGVASAEAPGRRALSLTAQPGARKRWALVSTASDFPVGDGVSFDVDYRVPKGLKGGRMQVLVQSPGAKAGRGVLRWSWTSEEEMLEAQDSRTKPSVLWSARAAGDPEWHRVKVTVTPREVVLHRDGVEAVRRPHGLSMERAGLTLGSTADRRTREAFECQVGRVVVSRGR